MTLTMARDLGNLGIRCMTIAPSLFQTGLTARVTEDAAHNMTKDAAFPHRMGKPHEFATMAIAIIESPMMNGGTLRGYRTGVCAEVVNRDADRRRIQKHSTSTTKLMTSPIRGRSDHSWCSSMVMDEQASSGTGGFRICRATTRVIRPDMPGLEQSSMPLDLNRDITLDLLLSDLTAIFRDVGAESVHYCGESMGGILGLALAARSPELVKTLTIVSTPVFIEEQMKSRYAMGHGSRIAMQAMGIREWVAATTRKTRLPADSEPGLFNWYVDEFAKGDDVQVAMSKLVNGANASASWAMSKRRCWGLYPNAGQITSEQQIRLLEEQLSNFRLLRFVTDYHMVQLLFPEQCTENIIAFLKQHDGP